MIPQSRKKPAFENLQGYPSGRSPAGPVHCARENTHGAKAPFPPPVRVSLVWASIRYPVLPVLIQNRADLPCLTAGCMSGFGGMDEEGSQASSTLSYFK